MLPLAGAPIVAEDSFRFPYGCEFQESPPNLLCKPDHSLSSDRNTAWKVSRNRAYRYRYETKCRRVEDVGRRKRPKLNSNFQLTWTIRTTLSRCRCNGCERMAVNFRAFRFVWQTDETVNSSGESVRDIGQSGEGIARFQHAATQFRRSLRDAINANVPILLSRDVKSDCLILRLASLRSRAELGRCNKRDSGRRVISL